MKQYFGQQDAELDGYEVTHRQRRPKRKKQDRDENPQMESAAKLHPLPGDEREHGSGKRKEKKRGAKGTDRLFQLIHPAVLLSTLAGLVVIELLFWLKILHLTETGGLVFLLIAVEILINRAWRKSVEKKKNEENRWVIEEEEERYRMLQEEMYEEVPNVQPIEETRCLILEEEKKGFLLRPVAGEGVQERYPEITIGTVPLLVGKIEGEADIILNTPTVSRMHARLECREGIYYVRDLSSKNGTFVNGQRLHPQEQREIVPGDQIVFAQIAYQVIG